MRKALLLSLIWIFGSASAAWADPVVMKIGTATIGEKSDSQFMLMSLFKTAVERDSKGRIAVQLYPNSQLGSIPRQIEGLQFGSIQGYVGAPEFLTGVDERFQMLSAPGVFRSVAQFYKTLEDPQFNRAFLDLGAEKGIKGIGLTYAVPASIYSRRPLQKPSDVAGMKIRTLAGPLQSGEVQLLGGAAIPMPLDQVLIALQQGAIDGVLAGVTIGSTFKYYTVAKYMLEINQPYVATIMIVSKTWFDQLPADLQKIVSEDGQRVAREAFGPTQQIVGRARRDWIAGGGQLVELTAAQQNQLSDQLSKVGPDVFKDKPPLMRLYDLMLATANRYR
jgi:TRAP-type transport system periplasmic protein